ncbi:hypothetical protein KKJ06_10050 [Xenorhabdus bovienii]|uniref:pilus-assembly fibrillin subunit n=1 Tax=Xenorhabdus bovienii TaxID=40576 RepID=UPI0023B2AE50|nr:pilus-assembly fibrillin subunit [Xenorhabdus bovienii]MDE9498459.1 hypothetical protein [Xenorhabdus bovienii]MDE9541817.1 hypothetical protein [Xenorhabdus bovienii]MDE9555762.1 hypothetical protein [Xenorhabdus bovienii]MDE9563154.1 hypothetical protein [Xenorhabdus bovienii]
MYRTKNHRHIRTTLLLGLVLFTTDKGYADEVIPERHDAHITQVMSREKSRLMREQIPGREGQLEVYGALVSSPCSLVPSSHQIPKQGELLMIELIGCGEGLISKNPPLPINVTLTASEHYGQRTALYQRSHWAIHSENPQLKIVSDNALKDKSNLRLEISYD